MRTRLLISALLAALVAPSLVSAGTATIWLNSSSAADSTGSIDASGSTDRSTAGSIALELGASEGGETAVTVPMDGITMPAMNVADPRLSTLIRAGIRLTASAQGSMIAEADGSRVLAVHGPATGRAAPGRRAKEFDLTISALLPAPGEESQGVELWSEGWDPGERDQNARPRFSVVIPGSFEE